MTPMTVPTPPHPRARAKPPFDGAPRPEGAPRSERAFRSRRALRSFVGPLSGILIAFVSLPAPAQAPESGGIARAAADLDQGRIFEAVEQFWRVAVEDPSSPSAYFYLSTIYAAMGEGERARGLLDQAREAGLNAGTFHYQMGVIRRREGDGPAALASFEEAVRLGFRGSDGEIWRHIGDLRVERLDWEGAVAAYANALKIRPDNARARLGLGRLYYDRNEIERAVDELRQALETNPRLADAYRFLGLAYRRLGELEASIDVLREGVEGSPSDQALRYALAQSLMAAGETGEAELQMEGYRRIEETMFRAAESMETGRERLEAGDLTEAGRLFEQAVGLAPGSYEAQEGLGTVLLGRGDPEAAVPVLTRAVAENPLGAEAYFRLGLAYLKLEDAARALESARRAAVIDPEDTRYRELLQKLEAGAGGGARE